MINKVVIVGRLTRDAEIKKAGENSVCTFTVAIDNRVKANGEKTTSFIPCIAWGKTAENICKYTHKGVLIAVDGHMVQRSYKNKDGRTVSVIEIVSDSVQFLEPKKTETAVAVSGEESSSEAEDVTSDDSLPF